MEKLVIYSIEKLELEIKIEKKSKKFNRQHIFIDIKNYIRKDLKPSDTLKLNYHFYVFEKCLQLTREKEYGLAKFWINEAENSFKGLDPYLQRPLSLLYLPMLAYYYYALKNYDKTLDLLNKERKAIDEIFLNAKDLSTEFNLEQLINLYRTYFDKEDSSEALHYGRSIFKFLVSEEENDIVKGDLKKLKEVNIKNVENWICYVTDSILKKILFNNQVSNIEYFCNLFVPIVDPHFYWKNFPIKGYKSAVTSVIAFEQKNYNQQLFEAIKMIDNISEIPPYLQFIALDCLSQTVNNHFPEHASRYLDAFDSYNKRILKIKLEEKTCN